MIKIKNKFSVIGVMSGTSMDGLDVACVNYYKQKTKWCFKLLKAETFIYDQEIKKNFIQAYNKELSISYLDEKFGHIISDFLKTFINKNDLTVDLISSHGHTIFHEPKKGKTTQIGSGSIIAHNTQIPVVCNFREQDIDLGGQGAPLVPVGDRLLFSEYDACLNLGGIANISYEKLSSRLAYDICPCNILLNYIVNKLGKDFDSEGKIASKGIIDDNLLATLNNLDYYNYTFPKSLGMEHIDAFLPILSSATISVPDLLATLTEHIAIQLGTVFSQLELNKILVTGGGAFNNHLIRRIKIHSNASLVFPSQILSASRRLLCLGFWVFCRILKQNNCLSSATGAKKDHSSGDVYLV